MLDQRLPQYTIRENYRPDWLISSDRTHLELDFYIEELGIAFEVQGQQHFQFVPFFHKSEDDFKMRRRHDGEKRILCYGQRVKLIEIMTETDAIVAIKNIEEKIKKDQPKYFYQDEQKYTPQAIHKYNKRKSAKATVVNSDEEMTRRLEKCKNNLLLFETGQLEANEEKVYFWRKVVSENGLGRDWKTSIPDGEL